MPIITQQNKKEVVYLNLSRIVLVHILCMIFIFQACIMYDFIAQGLYWYIYYDHDILLWSKQNDNTYKLCQFTMLNGEGLYIVGWLLFAVS